MNLTDREDYGAFDTAVDGFCDVNDAIDLTNESSPSPKIPDTGGVVNLSDPEDRGFGFGGQDPENTPGAPKVKLTLKPKTLC